MSPKPFIRLTILTPDGYPTAMLAFGRGGEIRVLPSDADKEPILLEWDRREVESIVRTIPEDALADMIEAGRDVCIRLEDVGTLPPPLRA